MSAARRRRMKTYARRYLHLQACVVLEKLPQPNRLQRLCRGAHEIFVLPEERAVPGAVETAALERQTVDPPAPARKTFGDEPPTRGRDIGASAAVYRMRETTEEIHEPIWGVVGHAPGPLYRAH